MENKNAGFGVVLLSVMMIVFFPMLSNAYVSTFAVDGDRYATSGRINMDFSYNDLDIQPSDGGCMFRGTITNDSDVLQTADIEVQAVDASEKTLWRHTISLPAVSASDSYQFEETVDDCPAAVPYRLKFEVSQ